MSCGRAWLSLVCIHGLLQCVSVLEMVCVCAVCVSQRMREAAGSVTRLQCVPSCRLCRGSRADPAQVAGSYSSRLLIHAANGTLRGG